jgi:hypothetical protein
MSIVSEYSWESDTWTHHNGDESARQAFRQAVAAIAAKAKETLPECNGRVDKAVAIVLNGDVELLEGGKAKVASQSNGTTQYFVVNGTCECKDFPKAPSGWCKHRIAAGLAKRVAARVRAELDASANGQAAPASEPTPAQASPASPSTPLPEAPASVNCYVTMAGRQCQLTLRDTDETRLLQRLAVVLAQYPIAPACTPPPATPAPVVDGPPPCPMHGTRLLESRKAAGTFFCPVKAPEDGKYCQTRWPAKATSR